MSQKPTQKSSQNAAKKSKNLLQKSPKDQKDLSFVFWWGVVVSFYVLDTVDVENKSPLIGPLTGIDKDNKDFPLSFSAQHQFKKQSFDNFPVSWRI